MDREGAGGGGWGGGGRKSMRDPGKRRGGRGKTLNLLLLLRVLIITNCNKYLSGRAGADCRTYVCVRACVCMCVCVCVCVHCFIGDMFMIYYNILSFCLFKMYVNVVFVPSCLYSGVSLTLVREQRFERIHFYYYYI